MKHLADEELTKRVVEELDGDRQGENVDAELETQLAEMRRRALDAIPENPTDETTTRHWSLIVMGSCATLMVAAVLIFLPASPDRDSAEFAVSEIDMLTNSEDLEMLESDIEFYYWLESAQEES